MSEFKGRTSEELLRAVQTTENEYEESLREIFLAEKLFHNDHLMQALEHPGKYMDELGRLQGEFLAEKRGKNMGERFALALSDKYIGKVHVVELGDTSNPGVSGEIDGLKDEYRDLLSWMVENGIVERELTRSESGRKVALRKPIVAEAQDTLSIMIRSRALIDATIRHDDRTVSVGIAKRMVFSIPRQTLKGFFAASNSDDLNDGALLERVETCLQHGSGGIKPIRTAYYLATDIIT